MESPRVLCRKNTVFWHVLLESLLPSLSKTQQTYIIILILSTGILEASVIVLASRGFILSLFNSYPAFLACLIVFYYIARCYILSGINRYSMIAGHNKTKLSLRNLLNADYLDLSSVSLSRASSAFTQVSRNAIHGCFLQSVNAASSIVSFTAVLLTLIISSPLIVFTSLSIIFAPATLYSAISKAKSSQNSAKIVSLFTEQQKLISNFWKHFKFNFLENNQKKLYQQFISNDYNIRITESNNLTLTGSSRFVLELSAIASIIFSSIVFKDFTTISTNNSKIFGLIYGIYRVLPSIQQYYASESLISSHYFELKELLSISEFNVNRKAQVATLYPSYNEKFKDYPLVFKNSRFIFLNKEFNISIPNHIKMIALKGKSGSGKSTILDTLSSLYPLESGNIYINGVDFREKADEVSYLPQSSIPSDQTLGDYLSLNETTYLVAKTLLQNFQLFDLIFEDLLGLDTPLGKSDEILSGGQINRLTLVKFLIRDFSSKSLVLLDEFTNGNDREMRHKMINEVRKTLTDLNNVCMFTSHHDDDIALADAVIDISSLKSPTITFQ